MEPSPVDEMMSGCLAVRVRLIARAVSSLYDEALSGHGLTIAQVNLLVAIGKFGPCAPARLGEALQLDRSTVSRNLALLLKQGWIEAVSANARGVGEVRLGRAGRDKLAAVTPQWRRAQERAAQMLGGAGVEAVRGIADAVGMPPAA